MGPVWMTAVVWKARSQGHADVSGAGKKAEKQDLLAQESVGSHLKSGDVSHSLIQNLVSVYFESELFSSPSVLDAHLTCFHHEHAFSHFRILLSATRGKWEGVGWGGTPM